MIEDLLQSFLRGGAPWFFIGLGVGSVITASVAFAALVVSAPARPPYEGGPE